jgi:PAS domain S-box-containing protein/putative nucleotidyltransferase with HDIG domain
VRGVVEEHRRMRGEPEPAAAPQRILYVEHQPMDIELTLRHVAEAAPHLVMDVVRTCAEALTRLDRPHAYDLALVDLRMPDSSGLDFVREAKRRRLPLPPFIMISGQGDESAAIASLKLGASDYIVKREGYLNQLTFTMDHTIARDTLARLNARLRVELTDRKRAQEALRESEERFRLLFEESPSGIALVDTEGVLREANPTLLKLLSLGREDIVGRPFAELLPKFGLGREVQEADFRKRLADGPAARELTFQNQDGRQTTIDVRSAVLTSNSNVIGVMFLVNDFTDRKEAEEALSRNLEAMLGALGHAAEMRDPYTAGHQRRVTDLAVAIACKLGVADDERNALRVAGLLHDIGKLSIPAEILSKPTALTPIEFALIRTHPEAAHEILAEVGFQSSVAEVVLQHHERLDGSGYPRGLSGDNILLGARILAVADVVEAMASHRPYRPALGIDAALGEIRAGRGTRYDAGAVDACLELFEARRFSFTAEGPSKD